MPFLLPLLLTLSTALTAAEAAGIPRTARDAAGNDLLAYSLTKMVPPQLADSAHYVHDARFNGGEFWQPFSRVLRSNIVSNGGAPERIDPAHGDTPETHGFWQRVYGLDPHRHGKAQIKPNVKDEKYSKQFWLLFVFQDWCPAAKRVSQAFRELTRRIKSAEIAKVPIIKESVQQPYSLRKLMPPEVSIEVNHRVAFTKPVSEGLLDYGFQFGAVNASSDPWVAKALKMTPFGDYAIPLVLLRRGDEPDKLFRFVPETDVTAEILWDWVEKGHAEKGNVNTEVIKGVPQFPIDIAASAAGQNADSVGAWPSLSEIWLAMPEGLREVEHFILAHPAVTWTGMFLYGVLIGGFITRRA